MKLIKENQSYNTRAGSKASIFHHDGKFFHGVVFIKNKDDIPSRLTPDSKKIKHYKKEGFPMVWRNDGTCVGYRHISSFDLEDNNE